MSENRFKKSIDNATANTLNNIQDVITEGINPGVLGDILSAEKKERGVNHTFYLSADVAEDLSRLAKKTRRSKSAIVNDILRAVLTDKSVL